MVANLDLNVYSGEEGIADYYDPDKCPPIPVSLHGLEFERVHAV